MSKPISILLADDHALVRGTLKERLDRELDLTVVADVGTCKDAATQAVALQPDIVLLDIDMPDMLCFEAARTIRGRCEDTRIIFLSSFFHDQYIEQALAVEASGYITKSEPVESVIKAVREINVGGICFSPEVAARIVLDSQGARLAYRKKTRVSALTPREMDALRHLARGLSKKEAAEVMNVSVKTVEGHCDRLMGKLDIHDRVELTRFAIREGLVEA